MFFSLIRSRLFEDRCISLWFLSAFGWFFEGAGGNSCVEGDAWVALALAVGGLHGVGHHVDVEFVAWFAALGRWLFGGVFWSSFGWWKGGRMMGCLIMLMVAVLGIFGLAW